MTTYVPGTPSTLSIQPATKLREMAEKMKAEMDSRLKVEPSKIMYEKAIEAKIRKACPWIESLYPGFYATLARYDEYEQAVRDRGDKCFVSIFLGGDSFSRVSAKDADMAEATESFCFFM